MLAILRYQALFEAVPANTPAAATAAPTPARNAQPEESVDDIVGELLKTKPEPAEEADAGEEPEASEETAAEEGASEDEDSEEAEDDDAAPADDDDAAPDTLKSARKALADGDIDKAFQLAFGKKPEELQPDNKAWTAWRKANDKKAGEIENQRLGLAHQRQVNETWVAERQRELQGVIQQLKPYDAYFQLEQRFARDGDYSAIVEMVQHATKMNWDDAMKLVLTKSRRSPGERALQQRLEEQDRKLRELEEKRTTETQQQEQARIYQQDLTTIRGELKGEVTRVPQFAERVYRVLVQTKLPTGGLSMTVEEAGRRVLAAERRRLEGHPLLKKPAAPPKDPKVSQAARTLAQTRKPKTGAAPPLRRDSQSNGAKDDKDESVDDILGDILKSPNRKRAAL